MRTRPDYALAVPSRTRFNFLHILSVARESFGPSVERRAHPRDVDRCSLENGQDLGSAIVVRADRPSANDPEYYKLLSEQAWMILKDRPGISSYASILGRDL